MRLLLSFSHGGSSSLAQLTGPMTTSLTLLLPAQPRCSTAFWEVLHLLALCGHRTHLGRDETSTSQVCCLHNGGESFPSLPAQALLSENWTSRRDDAFELQLPQLSSPRNSPAKVQDCFWSNCSIQVDVKLYLQ